MKNICVIILLLCLTTNLYAGGDQPKDKNVEIVLPPVKVDTVEEPLEIEPTVEVEPVEIEVTEVVEVVETVEVVEPVIEVEDEVEEITEIIEEVETKTSLGTFVLTAYCSCVDCCGEYALNRPLDENGNSIVYTASGAIAQAGLTIAVDPTVIPYGSKVEINGHTYVAHDTGGAIKGNRIDVYFADHVEAWNFGRQEAEVFLVKE